MYETVNQELNIYSCRLADLKIGQVQSILSQWEEGVSIGELTLFVDRRTNQIVINADNSDYFYTREFVVAYMEADDSTREKWKNKTSGTIKDIRRVLDECIKNRRIDKEIQNALRGCVSLKDREVLRVIHDKHSDVQCMTSFLYGVMQGKRAERAKNKKRGN